MMDTGYVVLLLLILVYCSAAIFLYLRARQEAPSPEAAEEMAKEEPEAP
jgi:hypothetical protein